MKKKLLLILPFAPLPITSGGTQRIFHTIKKMSKAYDLYLIDYKQIGMVSNPDLDDYYQKHTKHHSSIELLPKRHFSYCDARIPFWFSDWYNEEIIYLVNNLIEQYQIDLVQIEFSQLLFIKNYLPSSVKTTFLAHDLANISFFRRMMEQQNLLKKMVHFKRWLEVYCYEKKYLKQFDQIIAVSDLDKQYLQKLFQIKNAIMVEPNGIESINFLPKRSADGILNLGYIGSINHAPNIKAIKYLIEEILPKLRQANIPTRIILAGYQDEEQFKQIFANPPSELVCLGQVQNLAGFYSQIDVLVAPIFSGSGTRIKILESLSYGRPVVTTKIGAEGLNLKTNYLKIVKNSNWLEEIEDCQNKLEPLTQLTEKLNPYLW